MLVNSFLLHHLRWRYALTFTRLLLHSRHPFRDFLWLFLDPESPIPITGERRAIQPLALWLILYHIAKHATTGYADAYNWG